MSKRYSLNSPFRKKGTTTINKQRTIIKTEKNEQLGLT